MRTYPESTSPIILSKKKPLKPLYREDGVGKDSQDIMWFINNKAEIMERCAMEELEETVVPTYSWENYVKTAMWGTYGKCGTQSLTFVRLIDCSTEHLQAILKQKGITPIYPPIIRKILSDRGVTIS
jgi:hypothetical protein